MNGAVAVDVNVNDIHPSLTSFLRERMKGISNP